MFGRYFNSEARIRFVATFIVRLEYICCYYNSKFRISMVATLIVRLEYVWSLL